ncbi:MAG: hypothetical protein ACRDQU_01795 [Pseudonocardiaceae bacterium]
MTKRLRLLILSVACLCLVAAPIRFNDAHPVAVSILQLVFVAIATTFIVMYFSKHDPRTSRRVPFSQVPLDRAGQLQVYAGGKNAISVRQAKIFAMSLLKPAELKQRLVETYEPGRRTLFQHVSIEVQIPSRLNKDDTSNPADPIYFPVLVPIKGKFQDNFSLFGADGTAIPVLSYREYLELAATTLRLLLATAYDSRAPFLLPSHVIKVEHAALSGIVHRRQPDGSIPWAKGWKRILTTPPRDEKGRIARDIAAEFARRLTQHYAIVAIVQPDEQGRFLLKYEQTLIPELEISSFRHRLGIFLGARPIDLTLSLDSASTCQSYHMRVMGGDGLYVGDQQLIDAEKTLRVAKKQSPAPTNLRFRKRLGQSYSHFYARFFPQPAVGERPRIRFRYFEVPPGSALRAAVSAIAALALIVMVGIINSRNPDPGTDAPAFLLAFPAAAATWLGFDTPTRRLLEGTLSARLTLIWTVTLSVFASGLYMAHRAFAEHPDGPYTVHWYRLPNQASIFWVTDVSWAVLVLLALLSALYMTSVYIFRTWLFSCLSSRPQGEDNDFVLKG